MKALFSDIWINYLNTISRKVDTNSITLNNNNNKVAVIIETRNDLKLELVVKNFIYFLNKDWNFVILHGNQNIKIADKLKQEFTKLKTINLGIDILDIKAYNNLLKSKKFYDLFSEQIILIYQLDTLLFKPIEDKFLKYSYIGAPWKEELNWTRITGQIGNGGLSIRNKDDMIYIIDNQLNNNFKNLLKKIKGNRKYQEDIFFSLGSKVFFNSKICPFDIANEFSVESIYHSNPTGIHKFYFKKSKLKNLIENIYLK